MNNEDRIEFLLIGLLFASSVLLTLFGVQSVSLVVALLSILLASYYAKVSKSDKGAVLIMALFVVQNTLLLMDSEWVKIVSTIFFASVVIWVIWIAVQHSRQYESVELVELSLGILLAVYILTYWVDMSKYGLPQEGVTLILPFAICFSIGTLMYSSNLWMRYNEGYKKVLLIVLVHVLAKLLIRTISNVTI